MYVSYCTDEHEVGFWIYQDLLSSKKNRLKSSYTSCRTIVNAEILLGICSESMADNRQKLPKRKSQTDRRKKFITMTGIEL